MPPRLLVVGHVTRDEQGDQVRLGGAASYAALAAARLGVDTALLTVAPPDDPLLATLRNVPGLRLRCVPDDTLTTFVLDYQGPRRSLRLRRRARALLPADVPSDWRGAQVAYVGPVAGECDRSIVDALEARFLGAGLQGWLRRTGPGDTVEPAELGEALDPPPLQAAVLSELDHPDVERIAARFVARGTTVAITRGAHGATLLTPAARLDVPAAPAHEVDPTGAGDVFGVVLTLGLADGLAPLEAAARAAEAAARVVEGPGLGCL
jgi:sugar/nucleoside kinase (ribokinase family)